MTTEHRKLADNNSYKLYLLELDVNRYKKFVLTSLAATAFCMGWAVFLYICLPWMPGIFAQGVALGLVLRGLISNLYRLKDAKADLEKFAHDQILKFSLNCSNPEELSSLYRRI